MVIQEMFKCRICHVSIGGQKEFLDHLKTHKKKKNKESDDLRCDLCQVQFETVDVFQRHLATHAGAKPYKCHTCGQSFRFKANRNQHELTHNEVDLVMCNRCHRSFSVARNLKRHQESKMGCRRWVRTQTIESDRPFKCLKCSNRYAESAALAKHIRTMHVGGAKFKCNVCGQSFRMQQSLNAHVVTIHDQPLKYQCNRCNQQFAILAYLVKHQQRSAGCKRWLTRAEKVVVDNDNETEAMPFQHPMTQMPETGDTPNVLHVRDRLYGDSILYRMHVVNNQPHMSDVPLQNGQSTGGENDETDETQLPDIGSDIIGAFPAMTDEEVANYIASWIMESEEMDDSQMHDDELGRSVTPNASRNNEVDDATNMSDEEIADLALWLIKTYSLDQL